MWSESGRFETDHRSKQKVGHKQLAATSWCSSQLPEDKISWQLARVKQLVP